MEIDVTDFFKKRICLSIIIFLIFIASISFILMHGMGQSNEFTIHNGRLVCEQQSIQTPNSLFVQEVHITEGAAVKQGEALVSVRNIVSDEEIQRLQKNVDLAQKNLEQIRYGFIDTLPAPPVPTEGLEAARVKMERMNELYEMGAVSAAKKNEAAAAYEQEKSARTTVQTVRRSDPTAVQTAEDQLKKAELALEKARNTEITELYAQRSGIISKVFVKEGSSLESGADILTINIVDHAWIEAKIPEKDADRVYLGQIVRYELNGRRAEGTVEEITDDVTGDGDDEGTGEKCIRISVPQEYTAEDEMMSDITLHFSS